MKEKAHSEISKERLSKHSDDVMIEDDFYTTHSGRQVRRRRSLPDQKESGMIIGQWQPIWYQFPKVFDFQVRMTSTRSRLPWSRLTPGRWRTFWGTTRRVSWTWSRTRRGGKSCSGSSSCSGTASTRWPGTLQRLRRRSSTRRGWRGAWWTTRRCSNPSYSISTPDS